MFPEGLPRSHPMSMSAASNGLSSSVFGLTTASSSPGFSRMRMSTNTCTAEPGLGESLPSSTSETPARTRKMSTITFHRSSRRRGMSSPSGGGVWAKDTRSTSPSMRPSSSSKSPSSPPPGEAALERQPGPPVLVLARRLEEQAREEEPGVLSERDDDRSVREREELGERLAGIQAPAHPEAAVLRDGRKQRRRQHEVLEHDLGVLADVEALPEVLERRALHAPVQLDAAEAQTAAVEREGSGVERTHEPVALRARPLRRGEEAEVMDRLRRQAEHAARADGDRHVRLQPDRAVPFDLEAELALDHRVVGAVGERHSRVDAVLGRVRVRGEEVRRHGDEEGQRVDLKRVAAAEARGDAEVRLPVGTRARRRSPSTGRGG